MKISNDTQMYFQFEKMTQECNSEVCGMYDVCGARVASQSGLVKSGCSERSEIWGYWTCIH